MDALIMAGGYGRRMGNRVVKPFLLFREKPLISWVIDAAKGSRYVDRIYAALSPKTRDIEQSLDIACVMTDGNGYVPDMIDALGKLCLKKTFVLSSDLPLITSIDLNYVAEQYKKQGKPALAVHVPLSLTKKLGLKPENVMCGLVPTGVNIVDAENLNGEEAILVSNNPSFAFNINTPEELNAALVFSKNK